MAWYAWHGTHRGYSKLSQPQIKITVTIGIYMTTQSSVSIHSRLQLTTTNLRGVADVYPAPWTDFTTSHARGWAPLIAAVRHYSFNVATHSLMNGKQNTTNKDSNIRNSTVNRMDHYAFITYSVKESYWKRLPQRDRHQLYYTTYGLQLTVTESIP